MRRSIDILFSLTVLMVLSPLLIAIAIAIVATSLGNPFYRGWRAGKEGKNFRMWKFRTMRHGAGKMGPITGKNDPRVTPLGRVLRKTKLDELPQLINVLLGDMTLVGPRPESPEIVALYSPSQRAVLRVKPGVTGQVQIGCADESETIPEGVEPQQYYINHLLEPKLRLDLEYIEKRTASTDMLVIFETAALMLRALIRA